MNTSVEQFDKYGYVVLKGIIKEETYKHYIESLKKIGKTQKKQSWTIPDGIVQNKDFWSIIFNEEVLSKVKDVLGEGFKFLQHNDLHYGYSSFAWHRDGINRSYDASFADWQEDKEPYKMVRCGFYFQPRENNFSLGVLPGSHKMSGLLSKEEFLQQDKWLSNFQNVIAKLGIEDPLKEKAEWIFTEPGDCVVFDPRLIHTGSEFEAEKYSIFAAYGIPNQHFFNHYTYYRHLRYDLGYKNFPKELVAELKKANLYQEEKKYVDSIKGSWVPSKSFAAISKWFT